ncbi:la domain-containing protein [Ditylenchus destructor]|uniref:La domain-containing protein n=1 Tax=Ditylenchus destructor TaxID=166010 RepID=A0AAD4MXG8_9BILA|nr:la domain-containing protein [Ditylenchus destructor]
MNVYVMICKWCTEASPRCFVIQQVNDVGNALKGVASANLPTNQDTQNKEGDGLFGSPPPQQQCPIPILPWWFSGISRSATPDSSMLLTPDQLRERLRRQLEYYFSRENLINDRYLRCQMDTDQFVPIKIFQSFPKVAQLLAHRPLTENKEQSDYELIIDILKLSDQVEVVGEKVRPVCKRCTIILRDIECADEKEVKAMFDDCPQKYQNITYGLNNSWYITFDTEEDTKLAFLHLKNLGKTFNHKPVHARIKTGPTPKFTTTESSIGQIIIHDAGAYQQPHAESTIDGGAKPESGALITNPALNSSYNLGMILAQYGYFPRATFIPSIALAKQHHISVPCTVPISIQTSDFSRQPIPMDIDHSPLGDGSPLSDFGKDSQLVKDEEMTKENMEPINTNEQNEESAPKKFIMDNCENSQSIYDGGGLVANYPPASTYSQIPNFGRQRITDVPRILNKGRHSPALIFASPLAYEYYNPYYYAAIAQPMEDYSLYTPNNNANNNTGNFHKRNSTSGPNPQRGIRRQETLNGPIENGKGSGGKDQEYNYKSRPFGTNFNNNDRGGYRSNSHYNGGPNRNRDQNYNDSRTRPQLAQRNHHNNNSNNENDPPQAPTKTQPLRSNSSTEPQQQPGNPAFQRSNSYQSHHNPQSAQGKWGWAKANTNNRDFGGRSPGPARASWRRGASNNNGNRGILGNNGLVLIEAKPLNSIMTNRELLTNSSEESGHHFLNNRRPQHLQPLIPRGQKEPWAERYQPPRTFGGNYEHIKSSSNNSSDNPEAGKAAVVRQNAEDHRDTELKEKKEATNQTYNFVEVEFPSLDTGRRSSAVSQKDDKDDSHSNNSVSEKSETVANKQNTFDETKIPKPEVPRNEPAKSNTCCYSAIVAGTYSRSKTTESISTTNSISGASLTNQDQPINENSATAPAKCSYAQTLKKHSNK